MLEIVRDTSVHAFLDEAGSLLYRSEPGNSLMLGLCEMTASSLEAPKIQPLLLRIIDGGKTVSAAIQTNPPLQNLVLTFSDEVQLKLLATHLKHQNFKFPGVVGPAEEAESFSDLWVDVIGKAKRLGMGQKIYRADQTVQPRNVPGELKIADARELDTVTQWLVHFSEESLPPSDRKSFDEMKIVMSKKTADKCVYLWIVDGKPVSMAHIGRPTKNGISVSGVFTPQHLRKRGYASAVIPPGLLSMERNFRSLFEKAKTEQPDSVYRVGARLAERLIENAQEVRVLHGDIHHENILASSVRGWLAIDPKCLAGERTYDVANTFYNPRGFLSPAELTETVERRCAIYSKRLKLDKHRILEFAFAFGCLSAAWCDEDGQSAKDILEISHSIRRRLEGAK